MAMFFSMTNQAYTCRCHRHGFDRHWNQCSQVILPDGESELHSHERGQLAMGDYASGAQGIYFSPLKTIPKH